MVWWGGTPARLTVPPEAPDTPKGVVMHTTHRGDFWRRTPPSATPALIAALGELVLSLLVFVAGTIAASVALGASPWTVIFGPVPGRPVLVWLAFVLPLVTIQGAIGLALRHPARALRTVGSVGAGVVAAVTALWVALALYDLVAALFTGMDRFIDTGGLGELLFVPPALLIAVLNARAARLGLRGVRRGGSTALATP